MSWSRISAPASWQRLGLDAGRLREIRPSLVYCAISGFGQDGPLAGNPAYDQIIQGMAGVMSITGDAASAPLRVGYPVADTMGGMTAAFAIAAALVRARQTGQGEVIDVSMLESMLAAMAWAVSNWLIAGVEPKPMGNENATAAPSGTFATANGLLNIAANKQEQFETLARLIGCDADLIRHPHFADREVRKANRTALKDRNRERPGEPVRVRMGWAVQRTMACRRAKCSACPTSFATSRSCRAARWCRPSPMSPAPAATSPCCVPAFAWPRAIRRLRGRRRNSAGIPPPFSNGLGYTADEIARLACDRRRLIAPLPGVARDATTTAKTGRRQGHSVRRPMSKSSGGNRMQRRSVMMAAGAALMIGGLAVPGQAFEPSNVECIAPANPGGGWDFTCRQIGKLMSDLGVVPGQVQVTNMAGGGGGVAYSHVVTKRNEDPNLIVAASTATATRLAQNQFAGLTADQVRFVGALGADYGVIVVAKDSPHQDLKSLVEAVKADPTSISFAGGSAAGGFDHLKVLQVLKADGFEDIRSVRYVSFDGGGDAITQMLGGHVQAMTGDISEAVGFIQSGDVRVVAVLSEERLPGDFADIPTGKEQGFDVVAPNWRGLYVPKGTGDVVFEYWAGALKTVGESAEWQQVMADNGLMPFFKVGGDFQGFVDSQIGSIQTLSREIGVIQ